MEKRMSFLILACLVLELTLLSQSHAQLLITSPTNGTVVNPGQTISIVVSVDPSVQIAGVLTDDPLGEPQATSSANQFSLTIPATITPGLYNLTAVGVANGTDVESGRVAIDVERPDHPIQLRIEPTIIRFRRVGQKIPMRVVGTFSDGSTIDITGSTGTGYVSQDPQVATVSSSGSVTAVSAGNTSVTAQANGVDFSIPVRVPPPPPNIITALSGSGQSAVEGQPFTQPLLAVVNNSNGAPVSGASVTFNGPATGPGAVFPGGNTALTNGSGQAQVTVAANNTAGENYVVTATTEGTTTSGIFVLTNQVPPPDFKIAGPSNSLTLKAGQSGSITLNVVPSGGFQGTVSFGCGGLPPLSSCQFQPNTVVLDGSNTPQSVSLTVMTTAPVASGVLSKTPAFPEVEVSLQMSVALIFGGFVLLLSSTAISRLGNRRAFLARTSGVHARVPDPSLMKKSGWSRLGTVVPAIVVLSLVIGCGGGGSGRNPGQGSPGTPVGTFAVSVTATVNGTTRSTVLTLTVQ